MIAVRDRQDFFRWENLVADSKQLQKAVSKK